MIVLGIILWAVGLLAGIGVLQTLGLVLVAVGLILYLLGASGRPFGPRNHYW